MKKLVIDVGASAIKYALMDNEANIYQKGQKPTPKDTLDNFLAVIKSLYQQFQFEIDGIAFSVPGTIDSNLGQIYAPGGLGYNENINLADKIGEFTNLPVSLENDGKSAALAELWKGNLKDCQDGIVIVVGSGLGGGIIKDGKLIKGQHFFAGEFSFIKQNDQADFFGNVWASRASTTALINYTAANKGINDINFDGRKVFEWISSGDQQATLALKMVAKNLALGIYNLQCILDPTKVLIGGGISKQPLLLKEINQELDLIYHNIPFDIPKPELDNCFFHNDSNLVGALYRFLQLYSN
ncbi:MAG: ROK family protein [Erysipelotrichaceae bacterium]